MAGLGGLDPGPQQAQQRQQQLWTQNQLQQAHTLAKALQDAALNSHPIYSPWEGASRLADALAGNVVQGAQANAEREQTGYTEQQLAKTLGIPIPGQPSTSLPSAPEPQNAANLDWNHYADRTFQIESGGNPNAHTGSNRGLGQFGPDEERRYGINDQNRTDPGAQRHALLQEGNENAQALSAAGLPVNEPNLYLLHQQGQAGGIALLQNPNAPTTQVLGRFYGDGGAKAITGNTYKDAPFHGQHPSTVLAGDFTGYWAGKFLHGLNPVSSAQAAEAPSAAAPVLTPEALAAHGQQNAPSFESRFGNQPQTFDQQGNPLPQGGTPATFDQRHQPMLPQTSPPPPQPANPGPIAAPAKPPMPAPAAASGAPASAPPGRPQVGVPPLPAGSGQPIPGALSLQQQHAILNLIGQPATHELGLQLAQKYLMPEKEMAPTGHAYFGTPGTGYTPYNMPGVPVPAGSPIEGPLGIKAHPVLPGSRGTEVQIPGLGGPTVEGVTKGLNDFKESFEKGGEAHKKAIVDWLRSQGYIQ